MKVLIMKLTLLIKNILAYIAIGIISLVTMIPCMIIAALPTRYRYGNKIFFFFANFYYRTTLRVLQLPINIQGRENIPQEPVIFIANHQSTLDIPAVGSIVGRRPHMWLVLSYYLRYPVIGFLIRRMNIPVEQDKSIKAARALIHVLRIARDTTYDFIIFPEGGRYSDGCIHHFYDGYALIVEKTKRPIIPIYLKNNYKIFPKESRVMYEYPLEVMVGKQLIIGSDETYQDFNIRVHDWFLAQQNSAHPNCNNENKN